MVGKLVLGLFFTEDLLVASANCAQPGAILACYGVRVELAAFREFITATLPAWPGRYLPRFTGPIRKF